MDAIVRQGLDAASGPSFTAFDNEYSAWNDCHFDNERKHKDPAIASALVRFLRRSMGKIAFSVVKRDIEVALAGADRLEDIRSIVERHFAEEATIAMQDGLLGANGELLAASDARRDWSPARAPAPTNNGGWFPSLEVLRRMAAGESPPKTQCLTGSCSAP